MLPGAEALKDITKPMNRILHSIERGMISSEYVSIESITSFVGLSQSKTEHWLGKLAKLDLIRRWTGHFTGYQLTIHGYDALALNALYDKQYIRAIGSEKGTGKESVVYYVQAPDESVRLLKFHRVGFTSFQHVRKKRRYTANKKHISALYASRLSAETEVKWLEEARKHNLPVPRVYASNRHIILMEHIVGWDLVEIKDIDEPAYVLEQVLDFIQGAWNAGFIHGDLSEFNIIINEDAEITVIDFPQAESKTHPNAVELLKRDIFNILKYFERKFGIRGDPETILNEVLQDDPYLTGK